MKKLLGALVLLWTGVILVTYYVVQKPGLLNSFAGLADTFWTLLVAAILLFNSYGLGKRILRVIRFDPLRSIEHLLLSLGMGLGGLGLLGLAVSIIQAARAPILSAIQIALFLFFLLNKDLSSLIKDVSSLRAKLNLAFSQYGPFTKLTLFSLLVFSFLLTLVPPFEAFDVLINHLAQPALILRDGGLRAVDNVTFWYPTLTENVYLWALGLGSERAPQVIHFAWGIITALLLWHWGTETWGIEIGRKTLLLLASIPSLVMLASWAYTDMPLGFYAVTSIYALTAYHSTNDNSYLYVSALLSGLAMGVKYQSFVIPLACGLILLFQRPISKAFNSALQFSLLALLIASPWYLRSAVYMGNPFYPFLLGGRYWDNFLATWWTDSDTGIGWDGFQIFLLPLHLTLGHRDVTYMDGRIGPLFLLLLPVILWILIPRPPRDSSRNLSLVSIGIFCILSFAAWTFGVISSAALWQSRYLFPAVMALTIPTALAWDSLRQFDTSRFRISFLVNMLVATVLALTIIDNMVFVLQRNPLAVAFGAQSRERYIERVNPSYAALMKLMDELPSDAHVLNLFEPRSYGLPRNIQPDVINSNFAHDLYLYQTPEVIIQQWKSRGYTHVLVYERGLNFMAENASNKFTTSAQKALSETLDQLTLTANTDDGVYSLYQIP